MYENWKFVKIENESFKFTAQGSASVTISLNWWLELETLYADI